MKKIFEWVLNVWWTICIAVTLPFEILKIMKEKDLNFLGALEYLDLQCDHELENLKRRKDEL